MSTEADTEVVIDPNEPIVAPAEGEPEVTVADAAKPAAEPASDGAAELQRQLADERARRVAAEQSVTKTQEQVALERINGGLAETEQQLADAKRDLEQAFEAADFKKASDLQEKIGELTASRLQLKQGKAGLEQRMANPQPRQAVDPADQKEAVLSRMSPRSQEYLRARETYLTDKDLNAKLIRAHHAAIGEGHAPDTDGYFAFLDSRMEAKPAEQPKPPARRPPMPAAPVSRASAPGSGESIRVSLTPREKAMATDGTIVWNYGPNKDKPIGIHEYAKRKYQIEQEDRARAVEN